MRNITQVIVFDKEQYEGDWPPTDATEYVAWFAAKLESIPSEYRATAKIIISGVGSYEDSYYLNIEIYYHRPEVDDEMAYRGVEERLREEQQKAQELRTLATLTAKYSGTAT